MPLRKQKSVSIQQSVKSAKIAATDSLCLWTEPTAIQSLLNTAGLTEESWHNFQDTTNWISLAICHSVPDRAHEHVNSKQMTEGKEETGPFW